MNQEKNYPPYDIEEIAFSKIGLDRATIIAAQAIMSKKENGSLNSTDKEALEDLRSNYHQYAQSAMLFRFEELLENYASNEKNYHLDLNFLAGVNRFITQDVDGSRDLYRDSKSRIDVIPHESLKGKAYAFIDKLTKQTGFNGVKALYESIETPVNSTVGLFGKVILDMRYSTGNRGSDQIRNKNKNKVKESFTETSLSLMKEMNKRQPFKNGNLETAIAFNRFLAAACHMEPVKPIDLTELKVAVREQAIGDDTKLRKIFQNSYNFSESKLQNIIDNRGDDTTGVKKKISYDGLLDDLKLDGANGDPDKVKVSNPAISYSDASNVLSQRDQDNYEELVKGNPQFEENLLKSRRRTR